MGLLNLSGHRSRESCLSLLTKYVNDCHHVINIDMAAAFSSSFHFSLFYFVSVFVAIQLATVRFLKTA